MLFKIFKVLLVISVVSLASVVAAALLFFHITSPPAFTDEQCEVVERNFDKLKVGMTKEEVIPLIGGERKVGVILNPGNFPGQHTRWEVWALCNNPQTDYEWYFIAFDTKTNKVVKIASDDPEAYRFD